MKKHEIVNMRIARLAGSPVLLAGDIDRGGVFAAIAGTLYLLDENEREMTKGFIINKFRGDITLLQPGIDFLEKDSGKPVLGVVPYLRHIAIPQEDSVYLDERSNNKAAGGIEIAVIRLPHISNYDDFDPLEEDGCRVNYVNSLNELGRPHLIILPGSKSVAADLYLLWNSGVAEEIIRQAKGGVPVLGICGGYQMLGREIKDPERVESAAPSAKGLGLLDIITVFDKHKRTVQVRAQVAADKGLLSGLKGQAVSGYEIHMGKCLMQNEQSAFSVLQTPRRDAEYEDGAVNSAGKVIGTFIHGIFNNASFRQGFLDSLRQCHGLAKVDSPAKKQDEDRYDRLAACIRPHLDMKRIYRIIEESA